MGARRQARTQGGLPFPEEFLMCPRQFHDELSRDQPQHGRAVLGLHQGMNGWFALNAEQDQMFCETGIRDAVDLHMRLLTLAVRSHPQDHVRDIGVAECGDGAGRGPVAGEVIVELRVVVGPTQRGQRLAEPRQVRAVQGELLDR